MKQDYPPSAVRQHHNADSLDFESAASLLRSYLTSDGRDVVAAAIFGSVAKGCNSQASDIDALIVSRASKLTKQNVRFKGERLQIIDGPAIAIRQRITDAPRSRNDFLPSIVLECRWVAGDRQILSGLKEEAASITKAGLPPLHHNQYLSTRSRCADAIEKIRSSTDVYHRMFVAQRIYSLLHELAAANNRVSPYQGTATYPQFVKLAPVFAVKMAEQLREGIAQDNYDRFMESVQLLFMEAGGFTWECETAIPI